MFPMLSQEYHHRARYQITPQDTATVPPPHAALFMRTKLLLLVPE